MEFCPAAMTYCPYLISIKISRINHAYPQTEATILTQCPP